MHQQQMEYCMQIRDRFPAYFINKKVLDVGSYDINGSNKVLFQNCEYIGIDIEAGRNVDIVTRAHELNYPDSYFDTIISTECFEHDMYIDKTFSTIMRLLKQGGLFIFTAGGHGRPIHGTAVEYPESSPTSKIEEWKNYYKNLTEASVREMVDVDKAFSWFEFNIIKHDIRFCGIKA